MSKEILIVGDKVLIPYLFADGYLVLSKDNRLGQVFSHIEADTGLQRHYDINRLTAFAAEHFDEIIPGRIEFSAADIAFIREHSGIEQPRLDRLTPQELHIPGLIVHLDDNTDIVIDGNHRAVRRFELGYKFMDFCIIGEAQAKLGLLAFPEAEGQWLALSGKKETEGV